MRDYKVGEYIEYIPTDEERVLYRLCSSKFLKFYFKSYLQNINMKL